MALYVVPEHLPVIGAELAVAQAALNATLSAAAAVAAPAPAVGDPVTIAASAAFTAYMGKFFPVTSTGTGHLLAGAQALAPVGVSYQATDVDGGAVVAPHGAVFTGR
ncbi:hypothetical protein BOX37_26575 [Nocardia mangyaensis]|uniref:PE domain-containing protein n=1 Tax=Nocardia mangyaensis TaxID=2213200 RepID=A0A1J0VXX3_9NOCA|nr:PE domain-containing protein [Nocardia mangyaensis]APE36907.1 hypothetical protein BOX37_26575 [Nocardia mangyaensis]